MSRTRATVAVKGRRAKQAKAPARRRITLSRRFARVGVVALVLLAIAAAAWFEARTSWLEAQLFARLAARAGWTVGAGPSLSPVQAPRGPFDVRRGYSSMPDFEARLSHSGLRVATQAAGSSLLEWLSKRSITPPFADKPNAALTIRAAGATELYRGAGDERGFASFEQVPRLLVDSLLFIENKQLLTPLYATRNPTLEWSRLGKAVLSYGQSLVGLGAGLEGGSTLATQLEKFRHSPGGRTASGREKVRQLVAASLRSYLNGADTRERRREIVVEYLNSIPLAAVPGYGEVYGLGAGLRSWFGLALDDVVDALSDERGAEAKVRAYKHALALIVALRAPYTYLSSDRAALDQRVRAYLTLFARQGLISEPFAEAVAACPLEFQRGVRHRPVTSFRDRKAINAVRNELADRLGVSNFYDLDRLDLDVDATLDRDLMRATDDLLNSLADPEFVRSHGLNGERLLGGGDPRRVLYSLLLFERTDEGNLLRVQADNLNKPLDLNRGIKLELGSTAKLRTLAHYLEVIAALYREHSRLKPDALRDRAAEARDPLTRWVVTLLQAQPSASLDGVLAAAMQRPFSADPSGSFFTGGGLHTFRNFDHNDDAATVPLIDAFRRSTNLVFIRLMRELVDYHRARLPYDADQVLADPKDAVRLNLLDEIAADEANTALRRAYSRFRGLDPHGVAVKLLGPRATDPRSWAILFFAWHRGTTEAELEQWLRQGLGAERSFDVGRLHRAYNNPALTVADFGFLLGRHPLEVWTAGELYGRPSSTRDEIFSLSDEARRVASKWLYKTGNRHAQDRRLRVRIEQDAFARMTPDWQRLGFPFAHLVASYATAIGSSGDRPAALADLMGIIVNDGRRRPTSMFRELRFATSTPYETTFRPDDPDGERVMEPAVARVLRESLAEVAQRGTARLIAGAFVGPDGLPLLIGGKTGTGDNRVRAFERSGAERGARVVNRTATFVFYVGDRYYGVLTAFVPGEDAARFSYTSSLAVNVLKLLAPAINERLREVEKDHG